ncbi:TauD/TfdA family dioxygenase [Sphingobium sufflavum]|uniref:TauD/TfdA dioxygenase family protein n=1 Tax=Sphingobium sufflavum TaxID=1129547 RepID=UPI001F37E1E0|nr:TauD/TfdA family dioxygenase [Sphingobium sufflavum]MCE7798879.1 TauD/TfdA family dioxygenase [Sphingobium sufflavum]
MDAVENDAVTRRDLSPRIGSEVILSKEALLSGVYAEQLREMLSQRGVLVVRGAFFDDAEQQAFTKTLGTPMAQTERDEVMKISMDTRVHASAEFQRGNVLWHIDMLSAETPNFASILSPRVLSDEGGETDFASTYAAWDDLPEDEKRAYEGLRVIHSLEASQLMVNPEPSLAKLQFWRDVSPPREHPLVWAHASGRKSLVLGASAYYVIGKSVEESRQILTRLREWTTQPQYSYRHEWQLGDLLIWDNTGTMHRVLPFPLESGRLMSRTAIEGEEPVA